VVQGDRVIKTRRRGERNKELVVQQLSKAL